MDISIALSNTCANILNKYPNADVFNPKHGDSIIKLIKGSSAQHTAIVLNDADIIWDNIEADSGTALLYHSPAIYNDGSVRDDFDFGDVVIINNAMARQAAELMYADTVHCGIYDLRLMLSTLGKIQRSEKPLYTTPSNPGNDFEAQHFAYCDPRNRDYQAEAERVFTKYLKQTGGYIAPVLEGVADMDSMMSRYPVTASVIIPVKDRPEVIADAIRSAATQATDFEYNVIVVDNQSQQATRDILSQCEKEYPNLHVIETTEPGLGIGGCWNVGIGSPECGAIAVQLDSDDVYSSEHTLQAIVDTFRRERCGLLIGSYRLTDITLNPLNDIIIDHREYTQQNGVNNALRVNGFGAPRCYLTELARRNPFKNVSYGEDYDLCLRLSRQCKVSRIYDVLYFCRRWGKNSDSNLTPARLAEFNRAKDSFRAEELALRRQMTTQAKDQGL